MPDILILMCIIGSGITSLLLLTDPFHQYKKISVILGIIFILLLSWLVVSIITFPPKNQWTKITTSLSNIPDITQNGNKQVIVNDGCIIDLGQMMGLCLPLDSEVIVYKKSTKWHLGIYYLIFKQDLYEVNRNEK